MKCNKDTSRSCLCQLCGIVITTVICFSIYHWGSNNDKACFALTLGATAFLFLCLYNIIFKENCKGTVVWVLSGLLVIVFANELYDYEKLETLIPILKNKDPIFFTIIILGAALAILLFIKLVIWIYNNPEDNGFGTISGGTSTSYDAGAVGSDHAPLTKGESTNTDYTVNASWSKIGRVLYFIVLDFLIGCAGCALFYMLYGKGVLKHNYDFFEIVAFLVESVGSVIMFFLAIGIVVIFFIEMLRIIASRIQAFTLSLKKDAKKDGVPLYAASLILDLVICFIAKIRAKIKKPL